jgi:hypothetical protein
MTKAKALETELRGELLDLAESISNKDKFVLAAHFDKSIQTISNYLEGQVRNLDFAEKLLTKIKKMKLVESNS